MWVFPLVWWLLTSLMNNALGSWHGDGSYGIKPIGSWVGLVSPANLFNEYHNNGFCDGPYVKISEVVYQEWLEKHFLLTGAVLQCSIFSIFQYTYSKSHWHIKSPSHLHKYLTILQYYWHTFYITTERCMYSLCAICTSYNLI